MQFRLDFLDRFSIGLSAAGGEEFHLGGGFRRQLL